jgi:putative colanic acid biosynthesis acetyltransferase WcaF
MSVYYTPKEKLMRVVWAIVCPLFFRLSPIFFHGWRNFILRLMGAKVGSNVQVFPSANITYPWLLEIGDRSVISWDVKIYNLGKITIGSDTVISQYTHLCGGTHDYAGKNFTLLRTGLNVGSNVWIGADAFVGPSVKVNSGSVVAARAVVVKDVESLTVVGGNPAAVIKHLQSAPGMKWF